VRRPLHPGVLGLLALAGLGTAPPALDREARRRQDVERQVADIVHRVVHLREADAVQVQSGAGIEVVELRAANRDFFIEPEEVDDFRRRLEEAFERGHRAAASASARLAHGEDRHISEAEVDKLAAHTGKPREEVVEEVERLIGRKVHVGEAPRPKQQPAGRQRKQPVRRARSERAAARKARRR